MRCHSPTPSSSANYWRSEQRYGDDLLTSDVAIDLGPGLVLIEVRSGYLNRRLRVSGDVAEFKRDLERVVLRKVRQLGNRVGDLPEDLELLMGMVEGGASLTA